MLKAIYLYWFHNDVYDKTSSTKWSFQLTLIKWIEIHNTSSQVKSSWSHQSTEAVQKQPEVFFKKGCS